ncbi:hypothetical protein HDU87_007741 [Geranomyces variabilis]|uniref:Uncharacterized protein n=1 Tax=Geranomyces variabilis TaxID=109894 RepID=A0AAD5TG76_9FUNG|nr:hypothetical protein HDU87_007741 [Geranomyces variabilis]
MLFLGCDFGDLPSSIRNHARTELPQVCLARGHDRLPEAHPALAATGEHISRSPPRSPRRRRDEDSVSRSVRSSRDDDRGERRRTSRDRHRSSHRSPDGRRSRSRSRSPRHKKSSSSGRRRRSVSSAPSSSASSSSSRSSSSGSESDASRRRRHKKRKSDKKERKGDKSKSKKKEKKEKLDKKKKRKDSKSATAQYGAYGVIAASDMFRMQAEFWTWLVEVKKTSPESLPNYKMKEVFLDFMEAYNTASLPSKKYYNLDKWEREQLVRQQAEAGDDAGMPEFDISKDEEMLKRHSKSLRMGKLPELNYSQDQLNELKKVSDDRVAADRLRKMGYQPKDSMGVRYERD